MVIALTTNDSNVMSRNICLGRYWFGTFPALAIMSDTSYIFG